jgi:MFS family permease
VFGVGSVGSIAGALTANRIQRAIGVGRTILIPTMLASLAMLAYPLAPRSFPLPVLIAGQAVFGFGAVAYNITQVSLRQAITPERLQGRMNAAMRWIVWGTIPLGMIAGGSIATAYGLRAALWVGAIGSLFTFLPVALSSVRSIRELPEPPPDPALSIEPLIRATVEVDA